MSLSYTLVSEGAQLIADLAHLQWQHTKVQFQELSRALTKQTVILIVSHTHVVFQTWMHTDKRTHTIQKLLQKYVHYANVTGTQRM